MRKTTAQRLSIAMIGTRGVPASYGGFETAVEEIGARLADRGHEVVVYCRDTAAASQREYRGMQLVQLGALHSRAVETLSHTALSVSHLSTHGGADVAFVFNAANSPFVPLLRARGIPVAVHVDGLEWRRAKWGRGGRTYYRMAESFAVRTADALIADAQGIADYYTQEFGAATELLTYGAAVQLNPTANRLPELGLVPGGFHVAVARLEPENHVHLIVEGYRASSARLPLIVVGTAPYGAEYISKLKELAGDDPRIRFVGGVWDQELLDELYANAYSYLHGHSVGGTNPSLLRAMGAAASVIAYDVSFNREVLGDAGRFFWTPADVAARIEEAELSPELQLELGDVLRARAAERYNWDSVTDGYEELARRLAAGYRYEPRGTARNPRSAWSARSESFTNA